MKCHLLFHALTNITININTSFSRIVQEKEMTKWLLKGTAVKKKTIVILITL